MTTPPGFSGCAEGRITGAEESITRRATPSELLAVPEPVVMNFTGSGSHTLSGDEQLVPVKGQLAIRATQPEVKT